MKYAALALLGTASAQYNLLFSNDYDWAGSCYETPDASLCNDDYNVQTELDGGIASWDYTYDMTFTVYNHASSSVSMWWVDYDGYQQWYADVDSGSSWSVSTDQAIAICDTDADVTAFVRDEYNGDIQVVV